MYPQMLNMYFLSCVLDFLAPRRCVGCGRRLLPEEEEVCVACITKLGRTRYWVHPRDNAMTEALRSFVEIEKAASWVYYAEDLAQRIVKAMKYHQRRWVGDICGQIMAREMMASGFFEGIDVIVPLPLAKNRLRQRGYNQSLHIAQGISEVTGIPIVADALRRKKFKQSQTRLSHVSRRDNVAGQFSVVDDSRLKGKHILVVDDVITTGSTISACIDPMAQVEGTKFSVLSLAFAGVGR